MEDMDVILRVKEENLAQTFKGDFDQKWSFYNRPFQREVKRRSSIAGDMNKIKTFTIKRRSSGASQTTRKLSDFKRKKSIEDFLHRYEVERQKRQADEEKRQAEWRKRQTEWEKRQAEWRKLQTRKEKQLEVREKRQENIENRQRKGQLSIEERMRMIDRIVKGLSLPWKRKCCTTMKDKLVTRNIENKRQYRSKEFNCSSPVVRPKSALSKTHKRRKSNTRNHPSATQKDPFQKTNTKPKSIKQKQSVQRPASRKSRQHPREVTKPLKGRSKRKPAPSLIMMDFINTNQSNNCQPLHDPSSQRERHRVLLSLMTEGKGLSKRHLQRHLQMNRSVESRILDTNQSGSKRKKVLKMNPVSVVRRKVKEKKAEKKKARKEEEKMRKDAAKKAKSEANKVKKRAKQAEKKAEKAAKKDAKPKKDNFVTKFFNSEFHGRDVKMANLVKGREKPKIVQKLEKRGLKFDKVKDLIPQTKRLSYKSARKEELKRKKNQPQTKIELSDVFPEAKPPSNTGDTSKQPPQPTEPTKPTTEAPKPKKKELPPIVFKTVDISEMPRVDFPDLQVPFDPTLNRIMPTTNFPRLLPHQPTQHCLHPISEIQEMIVNNLLTADQIRRQFQGPHRRRRRSTTARDVEEEKEVAKHLSRVSKKLSRQRELNDLLMHGIDLHRPHLVDGGPENRLGQRGEGRRTRPGAYRHQRTVDWWSQCVCPPQEKIQAVEELKERVNELGDEVEDINELCEGFL